MNPREAGEVSSVQESYMKQIHGTKFVWNSFKSTFKDPSNRSDAVMEETTWAMSLLRFVNDGDEIPRLRRQIS